MGSNGLTLKLDPALRSRTRRRATFRMHSGTRRLPVAMLASRTLGKHGERVSDHQKAPETLFRAHLSQATLKCKKEKECAKTATFTRSILKGLTQIRDSLPATGTAKLVQ